MITFKRFVKEAVLPQQQGTAGVNYSGELQRGGNPMIYTMWNTLKPKYPNIKSWGIWGDRAHQQRKSDHNTGDAIDIAISNVNEGNNIVREVISGNSNGPYKGYVKYIIFNRQIWNPSQGTRSYSGSNPHSAHVHVSFNRAAGAGGGSADQWPGGGDQQASTTNQQGGQSSAPGGEGSTEGGGGEVYDSWSGLGSALQGAVNTINNYGKGISM